MTHGRYPSRPDPREANGDSNVDLEDIVKRVQALEAAQKESDSFAKFMATRLASNDEHNARLTKSVDGFPKLVGDMLKGHRETTIKLMEGERRNLGLLFKDEKDAIRLLMEEEKKFFSDVVSDHGRRQEEADRRQNERIRELEKTHKRLDEAAARASKAGTQMEEMADRLPDFSRIENLPTKGTATKQWVAIVTVFATTLATLLAQILQATGKR